MVGLKDILGFITTLAWPLVVAIALIVFHEPLSDFLKEVARRATKLSITQLVAFELQLPEASPPKLDEFLPELQAFASGLQASDARADLRELWEEVGDKTIAIDYMIIDLGNGQQWLTSRLFIFAVMLERMRGLRCLVFLETRTHTAERRQVPRSFLGTALPDEVRWALACQYPWLEEAYVRAQVELYERNRPYQSYKQPVPILSTQGALKPFEANQLLDTFLKHVQDEEKDKDHHPDPESTSEWEFLEKKRKSYWEHANWIDEARLERDLDGALHKSEDAWFKDSLDISQIRRVQALLRRKGSFVALINGEGQFKSLIDRKALLEQVAERAGKAADDQLPTDSKQRER